MSDYTKFNIYRKQMQALGLNAKQYAKLIDIPYEVVKDMIYQKEGEYSMEIGNLLRKDMFKKHQEIESNFEQAKIEANEIKLNDQDTTIENYTNWYNENYEKEMLREKVKSGTTTDFLRKYNIVINNKKPSRWHNWAILSKNLTEINHMDSKVVEQYAKQLYEIYNGNEEKYLNKKFSESKNKKRTHVSKKNISLKTSFKESKEYQWYENFDIRKYMRENDLSIKDLSEKVGIEYSVGCKAFAKAYASMNTIKKLYRYFNKTVISHDSEPVILEPEQIIVPNVNLIGETPFKIENTNNNEILRKILVDRLTNEEKELIKIFGGKID